MWSVKYEPKTLSGFVGNKSAVSAALAHDWRTPLLVHGGAGTGKSVFARALATERGFELVEVSDENLSDAIKLSQTASLWGGRRMLLIDNVESVSDIKVVGELVEKTRNPLVLLTSDPKSKRLATVKKGCTEIGLRRPLPASLAKYLEGVLAKEGVTAPHSVLESVAKNAGGDFRAALNDLETLAAGRKKIEEGDAIVISSRDSVSDIYETLSKVYKGTGNLNEIVHAVQDLDERPETTLLWIEENMPAIFANKESIQNSMHYLARADQFLGRITRRQYWGFLRYVSELMTAGVTVNRPEKLAFARYNFPSYISTMGRTKKNRALSKSIGGKIGPLVHASNRTIASQYIPLYRTLIKAKKITAEEISAEFKLDEEEVGFISA